MSSSSRKRSNAQRTLLFWLKVRVILVPAILATYVVYAEMKAEEKHYESPMDVIDDFQKLKEQASDTRSNATLMTTNRVLSYERS